MMVFWDVTLCSAADR